MLTENRLPNNLYKEQPKPLLQKKRLINDPYGYQFYTDLYGCAFGLATVTSQKGNIFVRADKVAENPAAMLNNNDNITCVNRRLSLSTYKRVKINGKPYTKEPNICNICAVALEIGTYDADLRDPKFAKTNRPNRILSAIRNKQIDIPMPTYVVTGAKTYFVYVFDKPVVISGIKNVETRNNLLFLLKKTVIAMAEKISAVPGFFAVPVDLNGFIPMPGSFTVIYERERKTYGQMTAKERARLHDPNKPAYRKKKKTSLLCATPVNHFYYSASIKGSCISVKELTAQVLPNIVDYTEEKKKKAEARIDHNLPSISIKPTKHSNIYTMLNNRLQFLRKLINNPNYSTAVLCELFWTNCNQLLQSRSLAYKSFMAFYERFLKKLDYKELHNILHMDCSVHHTHRYFLKKLELTKDEAILLGFKCQTKEERKEYQVKYQPKYRQYKISKKYHELKPVTYKVIRSRMIKKAKRLYKEGLSLEEIGKELGRSVRTVRRYLAEENITSPYDLNRITLAKEARNSYKAGCSLAVIAKQLGKSENTVRSYLTLINANFDFRAMKKKQLVKKAKALSKEGCSFEDIAKELNLSVNTIKRYLNRKKKLAA